MESKDRLTQWLKNLKSIVKAYDEPAICSDNDNLSISTIDGELYIGVAGSNGDSKDWIGAKGNLRTKQTKIKALNKKASSGFSRSALSCFDKLKARLKNHTIDSLNISGHSRGGPIASIIACLAQEKGLAKNIKLTTFGAPKWTTDAGFNKYRVIKNSDRVVSAGDKITEIPPTTRFKKFIHFGNNFIIGEEKSRHMSKLFDYYDAHMLSTYQVLCYEALEDIENH